jgi:putative PEP-CTERM system histidine kinase
MLITAFIIAYSLLSLLFCLLIFIRQKKRPALIPLAVIAVSAPIHGLYAKSLFAFSVQHGFDLFTIDYAVSLVILLAVIESVFAIYRPATTRSLLLSSNTRKYSLFFSPWTWRCLAAFAIVAGLLQPLHTTSLTTNQTYVYILDFGDSILFYLRLILDLAVLFSLENIYRYAPPHLRRAGLFSFLAFALLAVFDAIFTVRSLLFSTLTQQYAEASIIIYGTCIPIALFGFIRQRMSEEKIVISRAGIYSSLTLILSGALLLGLGVTVAIVQQLGVRFNYFEQFLGIFCFVVFVILLAGSRWMRLRILRFVNQNFYRLKYDYRDQFFRLHHTYMAGDRLQDSVNALLENLNYSAAIGRSSVFLHNTQDGNYYLHDDPDSAALSASAIRGDSPVIKAFEASDEPCILTQPALSDRVAHAFNEPVIKSMAISAIFPIKHQKELLGLLAIKQAPRKALDGEDISLVKVFTVSIGNVIAKYRLSKEHIEYKQFESFHRITTYIVHDIKNQVATLSLVMKNADTNLNNPDFQKSLMRSLKSCSQNLQALVDKLSSPIKQKDLSRQNEEVNRIVEEAIDSTGVKTHGAVRLDSRLAATQLACVDKISLFYILKNLLLNALDAMPAGGELAIATGNIAAMQPQEKAMFGIGDWLLTHNTVFILVKDSGCGMSAAFREQKLFQPFTSTKDKGIGIGLYQCKQLVEKMGGRLLCHSQENVGTQFCVIV